MAVCVQTESGFPTKKEIVSSKDVVNIRQNFLEIIDAQTTLISKGSPKLTRLFLENKLVL